MAVVHEDKVVVTPFIVAVIGEAELYASPSPMSNGKVITIIDPDAIAIFGVILNVNMEGWALVTKLDIELTEAVS